MVQRTREPNHRARLGRRLSSLKPAAEMAVVTLQTIAPEPPKSLLAPADSLVGHAESLLATVGPEETISTAVTTTPEFVKDPDKSQFAASLLAEPIEDALMAAPRVELSAPGKAASATPSESKQKHSKRRSERSAGEEPQLPAKGEAIADSMLMCARIEVLAKRLECFDKLKRGGAGQTRSAGEGRGG